MVSKYGIPQKIFSSGYFRKGKQRLTREVMLVQFQWICLKHILFIHDCLSRDLLFTKLEAYGLDIGSLNFLLDYLSLRNYRK